MVLKLYYLACPVNLPQALYLLSVCLNLTQLTCQHSVIPSSWCGAAVCLRRPALSSNTASVLLCRVTTQHSEKVQVCWLCQGLILKGHTFFQTSRRTGNAASQNKSWSYWNETNLMHRDTKVFFCFINPNANAIIIYDSFMFVLQCLPMHIQLFLML